VFDSHPDKRYLQYSWSEAQVPRYRFPSTSGAFGAMNEAYSFWYYS
jgi:hypothetical protein